MPIPLTAEEVLNREFLEIRAKILELAAAFDRLDRATGSVGGDPRMARLQEAIDSITAQKRERAEQVQLIFSRPYESDWQESMELA